MRLREKIGKMPAWKAAVLMLFLLAFLMVAAEEIFVSRIFSVMGNMIIAFEKDKKTEMQEWDEDEKRSAELDRKWHKDFHDSWDKWEEQSKQAQQSMYCRDYLKVKRIQAYLKKPLVESKDLVLRAWERGQRERLQEEIKPKHITWIEDAIRNKYFDPSRCKEEVS